MESRTMVGAGAPPPPSEVKIRTMKSDLASMAQSGGGMPRFENVAVGNLSIEKEYTTPSHAANLATPVAVAAAQPVFAQPAQSAQTAQPQPAFQPPASQAATPNTSPRKDLYPIFIVAVVAILAIGGVGYFAYITFFTGTTPQTTTQTQTATLPAATTATTATTTSTTPSGSPVAPATPSNSPSSGISSSEELSSAHISLFKKPADQVITIDFTGTTSATYQKTMLSSLSTVNPASTMIEISPKADAAANVTIQGLLSVAGGSILDQQALADSNPDATFFVYRDKNGLWPGYVIALSAGETSSSAAVNVDQLEKSLTIGNLFLTNAGTPSSDGFTDSVIAGVPVRVLPFSGVSFPLYFSYGWYGNDLILSTSNNGFSAAVASLQ